MLLPARWLPSDNDNDTNDAATHQLRITGDIYIEYRSPVRDFQMKQAVVDAFRTANSKYIYITRLYEANVATFGSIDIDGVRAVLLVWMVRSGRPAMIPAAGSAAVGRRAIIQQQQRWTMKRSAVRRTACSSCHR